MSGQAREALAAMQSPFDGREDAESREFYATMDFKIRKVVGWSCSPMLPGVFWVPALGYSLRFPGNHLFEDLTTAKKELGFEIGVEINRLRMLRDNVDRYEDETKS